MLKINIRNIKVDNISNLGALNIGKTILSHNHAINTEYASGAPPEEDQAAQATAQGAITFTETSTTDGTPSLAGIPTPAATPAPTGTPTPASTPPSARATYT